LEFDAGGGAFEAIKMRVECERPAVIEADDLYYAVGELEFRDPRR